MHRSMQRSWLALVALASTFPCAAEVDLTEVRFTSHGVVLSGSIVLPAGAEPRAGIVFVHGSGKQSRDLDLGRQFARQGIAALVYDKRGAGRSGGEYEAKQPVSEKNLALLADDAAAALRALAANPRLRGKPLGLAGISQAGWIVPLAAERTRLAQFLVLWSGPVCKVSEEDIYSKYTGDAGASVAPPYAQALRARTQRYVWPDFLGKDTDSAETLGGLRIPGLWIFSDDDHSIPVDLSIERLRSLRRRGHHYDYAMFSGLGHDNLEHTFVVATEWIRRRGGARVEASGIEHPRLKDSPNAPSAATQTTSGTPRRPAH
jgi:uncharacterized protein